MKSSLFAFVFLVSGAVSLFAQKPISIKIKDPVICYATTKDNPIVIPPPEEFIRWKNNPAARIKTADIQVDYFGFESQPEAQNAFQYAVDIWSALINSSVPIRIEAHWTTLGPNTLGAAIYTAAYANFDGAQKINVFYPVAIAEKITGQEMNDGESDLFAQFNSNFNWHFDPNSTPPSGKYDFISVVLHEIGHGLGFAGTFDVESTQGQFGLLGTGVPIIYDVPIENGSGINLIESFPSPSNNLRTQLTSSNLFFDSPTSGAPRLYAPSPFDAGSSISHVDENTFNDSPNSLMTPQIAPMEQMHSPGVALNMLKDMGWLNVKVNHEPLPNTENEDGPYVVTTTIQSDNGYNASTLKLHYTTNGTFTEVTMVPTGTVNEFSYTIPTTNEPSTYAYFFSIKDNAGTEYVNPGKIVTAGAPQEQNYFVFETGPDLQAPKITHSPKPFLLESDTELLIDAKVTDNIGLASVTLEYFINEDAQPNQSFTLTDPAEDSIYHSTITFGVALVNGDSIRYRIMAIDNSSNSNEGASPADDYHKIYVVGLAPTQDNYENDFNTASDDFFGNGFSITTPAGFSNPAIHTTHPYPEGQGFPDNRFNYIYQLRIPVRVKAVDATVNFDEIVLVEPGETGSVFPDEDFYDYVVVEGSKDGGINWIPVADGYDSRSNSAWLTRYNSALSGGGSAAIGDPTLFKPRSLDLLQEFNVGDEVVLRFRLFSDPGAAAWGWAIDNLKIQIDETPPLVLNNHTDYLFDDVDILEIISKVSDASGIEGLNFEYSINDDAVTIVPFDVDPSASQYEFSISGLAALSVGDVVHYRIVATDSAGNEGTFPPSGFINVPVFEFESPVDQYANNFNTASTDFIGNFFSAIQHSGFANGAIHSSHFYPTGRGLNKNSDFIYTLKKPITISDENTYIRFDEIALVEGHSNGIVFGNPLFNDYVIVEGSKDGGLTWSEFLDGYDAVGQSAWVTAFNNKSNGTPVMFRTRVIDMTENGNFVSNDEVIIRFRLFSTETINGWGWAIDNLYIQDEITETDENLELSVTVFPNPSKGNIQVQIEELSASYFQIDLINMQGQKIYDSTNEAVNGKILHTISAGAIPPGLYIVKVSVDGKSVIKKVIKL